MKKFHLLATGFASACMILPLMAQTIAVKDPLVNASTQLSIYLITFAEPGLLYNTGQNRSFAATSPSSTGARKLEARSSASVAYLSYLKAQQDDYLAQISSKIGRFVNPAHRYDITENGMAIALTKAESEVVSKIPGVTRVRADEVFELNTDAGPAFIGAPAIWGGTATPTGFGSRGEGVIVGVFDSGANPDHPSFANDPSCGFSTLNPKLVAFKDCNTTNCATGNGEDVSIFVDANNSGSSGHGVHTSSTAAGSVVTAGTLAAGVPAAYNMSGVAPCAKIISYKICGDTLPTGFGDCNFSAIEAAIQTSIVDQVDVVNFSVSGGINPWYDSDRGFLDMLNADILVSASAGNTRPAPNDIAAGAVNHRGPWVMTVANSTHDRVITNPVSVVGSLQNVLSQTSSVGFSSTVTAQVASALTLGNEYGCTASGGFAAGSMAGKIALIQRGPPAPGTSCTFVEKINNASGAGAMGVVMYDRTAGVPFTMLVAGTTIPSVLIRQAAGYAFRDFLTTNPTALMTVIAPLQRIISPLVADVLNSSSLKGPNIIGSTTVGSNNYNGTDTTKPDITGPGTNIYAALSDNFGQFGFLTGTSMSAPHLAGAAALLRSVHPTWTPTEVKSALMLTAQTTGRKPDEVAAWDNDDVGNGRSELRRAAMAGFVMDETFARFLAANPATTTTQEGVRQLNSPGMRNTQMVGSYVFTRTLRNTRTRPTTWSAITTGAPAGTTVTVVPSTFSFTGNLAQTQVVTITVQMTAASTTPKFGDVRFVGQDATAYDIFKAGFEDLPLIPDARLTLTVQGTP